MRVLSLCSGIGGLDLGVHLAVPGARTVAYVERDAYCQRVLRARIADGVLDDAPILDDVCEYHGEPGGADLVIAGFPCQPWSLAGKRRGTADDRWLWPEITRIVRELGCGLVFLENVPGLLTGGLGHVLGDLAALGFNAEWDVFSAAEAGAPHRRERVFILAYATGSGLQSRIGRPGEARRAIADSEGEDLAHANGHGCELVGERGLFDRERSAPGHYADRRNCTLGVIQDDAEEPGLEDWREGLSRVAGDDLADSNGGGPESWGVEGRDALVVTEQGRAEPSGAGHLPGADRGQELVDAERAGRDGLHVGVEPRHVATDARESGPRRPGRVAPWPPAPDDTEGWRTYLAAWPGLEPAVRRGPDGSAHRLDRLRALGNAVVPAQAAIAFRELWRRLG